MFLGLLFLGSVVGLTTVNETLLISSQITPLSPNTYRIITLPPLTGNTPHAFTLPICSSCPGQQIPIVVIVQPPKPVDKKKKKKKMSKRQLLIKTILGGYNAFLDEKERQHVERQEIEEEDE